jgi:peroxiredoxin
LLSDQKREAITRYDLVHKGAGEHGDDISRPAEFLLDSSGTVRWRMMTENYWRRMTPQQVFDAAKSLN